MKFGKEFRNHLEETIPEWRDKFLCYKLLKKLLKHFPSSAADGLQSNQFPLASAAVDSIDDRSDNGSGSSVHLQDWFIRILNEELEKFNDFFVDREEDFIIRFQELKERIERVKEKSGGRFTPESEFSEEIMEIRKDFVTIHGEMVLLKNYSSLNFAGLVKILKKYDKRTGGLLQLPFTQVALNQPFFITESLTRLVRECEANLELLFPLEAEVIESTSTPQEDSNPQSNNNTRNTNTSSPGTSNIGNETLDVYRSTLAAMKAIRGLQKASSTSNPLSFSSLSNKDDDDVGAVTAENSASSSPTTSSPTTLINGDHDQDDIHSK